jgi:flavorubredoxin
MSGHYVPPVRAFDAPEALVVGNDYSNAISITRNIFWVGFREGERLQCNPYLLVDRGSAVLVDPGSIPDFPLMMRKVIDVIDPSLIELVIVSHQDPDIAGCLPVLEDVIARPDLRVAAHPNTHRLIRHLGFRAEPYDVVEHGLEYVTATGDRLEFIPTPYAHSPGAMATYHRATQSLFTSDLFGAITPHEDIFDAPDFPRSMDAFHQAYMPSSAVLKAALRRLEGRPIQRLLPQHGTIIEGDAVRVAFEHLAALPCGIDLFDAEPDHA